MQCSARYSDYMMAEIIKLRARTSPGELKKLGLDEIQFKIHEFFLVIMNGETVGCFRIFDSDIYPKVSELGSVVSTHRGVGRAIAQYAEDFAKFTGQKIIAITGGKYDTTLEKQGWELATEKYKERMKESLDDKKCWEFGNS